MADTPYNPLDKRNLGESVAGALLKQGVGPLPPTKRIVGAGIYALYYAGAFELYRPYAERNSGANPDQLIYVGKAVPPGARKGGFGLNTTPGNALFRRLSEHAASIDATSNLSLSDFRCRYLISDDIWIPLGESLLIERFQPVWNVLIEGFGIHKPGAGRQKQVRSKWDTLHPGRKLATDLPPNPKSSEELGRLVVDFFAGKVKPAMTAEEAVLQEDED